MLIIILIELGDGWYNNVKWEFFGVFYVVIEVNGWFKVGEIFDVGKEGIDVYNMMLFVFDVLGRFGLEDCECVVVDGICF